MEAPTHWHLHGLSAIAWYILLIIQPWLYHNRPLKFHRKVGMISIMVAGFVGASAINMIMISLGVMSDQSPLFPVRYSLSFVDFISITGFLLSVALAVIYSKNTQVHARWMISTVFWVLAPGTVRFSFIPLGAYFQPEKFSDFPFGWTDVYIWNQVLIVLILLFLIIRDYRKQKTIYLSYSLVLIANIFFIPIILGLKDAPWLISILEALKL